MNTTTVATPAPLLPASAPPSARMALRALSALRLGTLAVQAPDGTVLHFGHGEPRAAVRLHDWQVCAAVLRRGDTGFAEAFMDGSWSTPDLRALIALFIANRDALQRLFYGSWWGSMLGRARHLLRRNSRRGSRRNIRAHYDLGNAFYRPWLDDTMTYSSAWFEGNPARPLRQAQHAKMHRALKASGVQPGQRLLEIGCGWGALAECAARDFGAIVTGLTLSAEQLAHGRQRLHDAGLQSSASLRLQDYRDIDDGPYDAIVSIEMFEAVGRDYWPSFFATLRSQLKRGGRACVQSIVIRDDLFERYARSTDFIQQHVFPGGLLPSAGAFRAQAAKAGLAVVDEFAFGADYAHTLRHWRAQFQAQDAAVRQLGFDARFMRLWEFYLAYCEAAFDAGDTNVMQFTLENP